MSDSNTGRFVSHCNKFTQKGGVMYWLLGNSVSQVFEPAPRFKENLLFPVTIKRLKSRATDSENKSHAVIVNHAKSLVLVLIKTIIWWQWPVLLTMPNMSPSI
jgi:hypothetical protein